MKNLTLIAALAGLASPLACAQTITFDDVAEIVRVRQNVVTVQVPGRQDCTGAQSGSRGIAGAIIGGIAGGILGNQVGGGNGKTAATAAAAATGAIVGDRIENGGSPNGANCVTTQPTTNQVANGRIVTYRYRGRDFEVLDRSDVLDSDYQGTNPTARVRVTVSAY